MDATTTALPKSFDATIIRILLDGHEFLDVCHPVDGETQKMIEEPAMTMAQQLIAEGTTFDRAVDRVELPSPFKVGESWERYQKYFWYRVLAAIRRCNQPGKDARSPKTPTAQEQENASMART